MEVRQRKGARGEKKSHWSKKKKKMLFCKVWGEYRWGWGGGALSVAGQRDDGRQDSIHGTSLTQIRTSQEASRVEEENERRWKEEK